MVIGRHSPRVMSTPGFESSELRRSQVRKDAYSICLEHDLSGKPFFQPEKLRRKRQQIRHDPTNY